VPPAFTARQAAECPAPAAFPPEMTSEYTFVAPERQNARLDLDVLRQLGLSVDGADRRADAYVRIPASKEAVFRAAVVRDGPSGRCSGKSDMNTTSDLGFTRREHRRETGHQAEIVASAMNASSRRESSGSTSSPNVSIWNRMADLTSARASS